MKNILCLLIILFGCVGVYAQEKVLTQSQFDAVYQGRLVIIASFSAVRLK